MKKVFLLFLVLVGILIVVSSCAASVAQEDYDAVVAERDAALEDYDAVVAERDAALAQVTSLQATMVEVNQWGFNNIPGEFVLEVEAGQEVAITFVYVGDDLPESNFHIIVSPEHSIATGILDRDNPEVTLHFTAREAGEIVFMCIAPECIGHHNLHTMPEM